MAPSVPSDPTARRGMSYPATPFHGPAAAGHQAPVAGREHHLEQGVAHGPHAEALAPAGRHGQHAAHRRAGPDVGLGPTLAGRGGQLGEVGRRQPGLHGHRQVGRLVGDDGAQPGRAQLVVRRQAGRPLRERVPPPTT